MKTVNFFALATLLLTLFIPEFAQAQWSQNTTSIWTSTTTKNVGIGTLTPQVKLDVNGNARMNQLSLSKNWDGTGGGPCLNLISDKPSILFSSGQNNNKWIMHVGSDFGGAFELYSNAGPVPAFVLTPGTNGTGSMGIGTLKLPAGYKLAVGGRIICEELKVQLQNAWPDYVFASTYRLKPLEEVEQHIAKNGHLPNIPSAGEVEENGISVGEMQTKMMEKIEELTLYLIDLKKDNAALRHEVEKLKHK